MKSFFLFVILIASLLLIGCGGSGGGGNRGNVERFQGQFSGTWVSTSTQHGTTSVVIQPNGSFDGEFVNLTISLTGTIEGQVTGDGSFEGTINLAGNVRTGDGQFTISEDGNSLTGTLDDNGNTLTFTLTRDLI